MPHGARTDLLSRPPSLREDIPEPFMLLRSKVTALVQAAVYLGGLRDIP